MRAVYQNYSRPKVEDFPHHHDGLIRNKAPASPVSLSIKKGTDVSTLA